MVRSSSPLFARAYHWHYWSLAIEGAYELGDRPATSFIPLLDTSEIIEYVLPSSILAERFPTRLDLSLSLLFRHEALFVLSPHATEMNGVRAGWEERMQLVRHELMLLRQRHEQSSEAQQVKRELDAISRDGLKRHAEELVRLLRNNHRWIFAAWRIPDYLDRVLNKLQVPSPTELDLPGGVTYRPNRQNVDRWMDRLDRTERGQGEPGPNLVDAYALDQLQHAAAHTAGRLPLFFTHSGKILEALSDARADDPDCLRVDGISLVQPPHVALVRRLRQDVQGSSALSEHENELERQRERCKRIAALAADIKRADDAAQTPDYGGLQKELEELEDLTEKWDALQKVRQTIDPEIHSRVPLVEELEKILKETPPDDRTFEEALKAALDELIEQVDRLMGQVASRSPLDPKATLEVDLSAAGEATASVRPDILSRAGEAPAVPSAVYPAVAYSFRDPTIIQYVQKFAALVSHARAAETPAQKRDAAARGATFRSEVNALAGHPEYYLLMAVVYLTQELWLEASSMAEHGLRALERVNTDEKNVLESELLLTRAGAIRAHALASRVDSPSICHDFLHSAAQNCVRSLALATQSQEKPDPRCLRELAMIFGSAREPVFGVAKEREPINLSIPAKGLRRWIEIKGRPNMLDVAAALARRAFELGGDRDGLRLFFLNTHLYAMTETDRLLSENESAVRYEEERIALAEELEHSVGTNDRNFLDTLMWHHYVLAATHRRMGGEWQSHKEKAEKLAAQIDPKPLDPNRFYQRLVQRHRRIVLPRPQKKRAEERR